MSNTASAQRTKRRHDCWLMFKHQICLTTGLLKSQLNIQPDQNLLISPFALSASLISLAHNQEDKIRWTLSQTLINSIDYSTNYQIKLFKAVQHKQMKKNAKSIQFNSFLYAHPSRNISHEKLLFKYRTIAKSANFYNPETNKPDLSFLQTINHDFSQGSQGSKVQMLSNLDYVTLVEPNIHTIFGSNLSFKGLWSKPFEVQQGLFRTSSGELIKTEFLHKTKSYLCGYDSLLKFQSIMINFRHDETLSLLLILPDSDISIQSFLNTNLTYRVLKNILKKRNLNRFRVALSFPRFSLSVDNKIPKPIQTLHLDQILGLRPNKQPYQAPVDQNVILLQRLSLELSEKAAPGYKESQNQSDLPKVQFKADRPFIFVLVNNHHEEKQILMAGVCEKPTTSSVEKFHNYQYPDISSFKNAHSH